MGVLDFLKSQTIEVIEWLDDSRDTLSWRFPDEDMAIKRGAQLIVRESQVAQFVYLGAFGDTFGPGKHTLTIWKRQLAPRNWMRKRMPPIAHSVWFRRRSPTQMRNG